MIFMSSEISEIDLEALFFRIFKIPNLDLQVKICFPSKILAQGRTDFTETTVFVFHLKTNIFRLCLASDDNLCPDPNLA